MKSLYLGMPRVARAVAGTLFDPGKGVEPARLDWFISDVDDFLMAAGPKTRLAIHAALMSVEYAPFLLNRQKLRFTELSQPERLRLLEQYEISKFTIFLAAIKAVFCLVYFEHPNSLIEADLDPRRVWPGVEKEFNIKIDLPPPGGETTGKPASRATASRISSPARDRFSSAGGSRQKGKRSGVARASGEEFN